jgi:hypothetical protein
MLVVCSPKTLYRTPVPRPNKRRGHGTYNNDRPPIVGTVGRDTHQVRLHVVHHTDRETLYVHVHRFTQTTAVATLMSGKAINIWVARM